MAATREVALGVLYDVAIVGAGPAGATCAAFCAANGLRVLLMEREKFPREKVCGDCINPGCWPVLRRLGVEELVRGAPHAALESVELIDRRGRVLHVDLPRGRQVEIAIKRSLLDDILLRRAGELGADVREGTIVTGIRREHGEWQLSAGAEQFSSALLVAADGRNSTVARLLGALPQATKERVALQAHIPLPRDFGSRIVLQLLPVGYSGQAPVNDRELNLCLVGKAATLPSLREWATQRFGLSAQQHWRTVTPLARRAISPTQPGLFFIGDAARVVEPFTGEGIFYALNSAEIAAEIICRLKRGANPQMARRDFRRAHAAMYHGRLWVNALTRAAVVSPSFGATLFELARILPPLARFFTRKIVS